MSEFSASLARFLVDGVSARPGADFALRPSPAAARFILRGDDAVRAAAGAAFGVEPPSRYGFAGEAAGKAAIWLGPDEWLLIAEGGDAAALGATLERALAGVPHSLVDISHRQVGVVVEGARAARALSAGCPLDLAPAAFPAGHATRTIFDKAEIVLWRRGATAFHVEVWRSFAPYLVEALGEAARGAPPY